MLVGPSPLNASEPASRPKTALRAIMNAATLKSCRVWTGDLIELLKTSPDSVVPGPPHAHDDERDGTHPSQVQITGIAIAWASASCPPGHILLSSQVRQNAGLELGSTVEIKGMTRPPPEAARMVLRPTSADDDYSLDSGLTILLKEILIDHRYAVCRWNIEAVYNGAPRQFVIEKCEFKTVSAGESEDGLLVGRITRSTDVVVVPLKKPRMAPSSGTRVGFHSIGGLSKEIGVVQGIVDLSIKNPESYSKYGVRPPRGILLHGPPGTGKTLIARAVAAESGAHVIVINGPEIISKFYGETEERLRKVFDEASANSPSIIFIDEIDSLCPKRDEAGTDLEKRVVTTLLTLLDGTDAKTSVADGVVVIAATNRPDSIDDALRRPGRFDRELEIGIPDAIARKEILIAQLKNVRHSLTDDQVSDVAATTHGFVGADLAAVCREAGLLTVKRVLGAAKNRFESLKDLRDEDCTIVFDDMKRAQGQVRPSAMREILIEVPKVLWTDIGGQEEIKQRLKEAVEWPLKHPEAFERFKIRPPKGILLYGPPGCSKTLMAKALATEAGLNFIAVKGPELFSKWVGDSEKAIRDVFKRARAASPSIVFFDEIDAIAVRRGSGDASVADRVLSQLLGEMDGIEPLVNVTVVAATNRPDILDSALLRPGRIDRILYVSPPNLESRLAILRIKVKKMACSDDVDIQELAQMMDGYSGAEVVSVCQDAALAAIEEDIDAKHVSRKHFLKAVKNVRPRITTEMIKFYDDFRKRSGFMSID